MACNEKLGRFVKGFSDVFLSAPYRLCVRTGRLMLNHPKTTSALLLGFCALLSRLDYDEYKNPRTLTAYVLGTKENGWGVRKVITDKGTLLCTDLPRIEYHTSAQVFGSIKDGKTYKFGVRGAPCISDIVSAEEVPTSP